MFCFWRFQLVRRYPSGQWLSLCKWSRVALLTSGFHLCVLLAGEHLTSERISARNRIKFVFYWPRPFSSVVVSAVRKGILCVECVVQTANIVSCYRWGKKLILEIAVVLSPLAKRLSAKGGSRSDTFVLFFRKCESVLLCQWHVGPIHELQLLQRAQLRH